MKNFLLIGLVLFAACEKKPEPQAADGTPGATSGDASVATSRDAAGRVDSASAPAARPQYSNAGGLTFNPARIARGDTAAGLTVTAADFTRGA
ncbi:MAG: hypothetical protein ABIS27_07820, partial [Longimicrobiales bacterium]